MPTLHISNLAARAESAGLDVAGFGGIARLSHTDVALLERGDAIRVSDATANRIAALLGMSTAALLGSTDDERDPSPGDDAEMERDAPAGVRSEPTRVQQDEDDVEPTPPFERALNDVVDADPGRYNDEDRELLAAALHHAEIPSTVGPDALPALAREWLESARASRGAREPNPAELCLRVARDGGRVARLMARRTIERTASVARATLAMANLR